MDIDFSEQRVKMVDGQIRTTDVTSAAVLAAMLAVPREDLCLRREPIWPISTRTFCFRTTAVKARAI